MSATRLEKDLIGEMEIPADRYFGIETLRACENFPVTGLRLSRYPRAVQAFGFVKKAAALANMELGMLDEKVGNAIVAACDQLIEESGMVAQRELSNFSEFSLSGITSEACLLDGCNYLPEFVVDVIQGGAGTSTNMNANEVIANLALEILGLEKGRYDVVDPHDHVNMSQSTNDAYPTAMRIALVMKLDGLKRRMRLLQNAFDDKGSEFADVIKMGRTQLQDAVPVYLGQEFAAWAVMAGEDMLRVADAQKLICEINMGGTAVGTGICSRPDYRRIVVRNLREITGLDDLQGAADLVEATQDTGAYVQLSGVLKRVAVKISKICNDLRLLSSGPRAGLNEINLPRMQPGSTIMPGKVNPVIPEMVNQVAYQVIGADVTVTMAAEAGQLELNVMEPVIFHNLFHSIDILGRACEILAKRCVKGITANRDVCRAMFENSIGLATALKPAIGYSKATEVAKAALVSGKSVREVALEMELLSEEELDALLKPENLVCPIHVGK